MGKAGVCRGIKSLCRIAFGPDQQYSNLQATGLVVDPKGYLGDYLHTLLVSEADTQLIRAMPPVRLMIN